VQFLSSPKSGAEFRDGDAGGSPATRRPAQKPAAGDDSPGVAEGGGDAENLPF
jgi:hypothetical protein